LAEGCQNKNAAGVWRPAAIGLVKVLSQPQVRAYRPKPIKEILAAGCAVHLLAVHEAKIAEPGMPSSITVARSKSEEGRTALNKDGSRWYGINPKAEIRGPKEVRSPKSECQPVS
jgi:hypothetical protein